MPQHLSVPGCRVPNNGADGAVGGFAAADVLPAAHLLVVRMLIRSRRTQTRRIRCRSTA